MGRTKERRKFIHEPSTHEIFYCLSGIPDYSKTLLEQNPVKPYSDFLRQLIGLNFYNERTEKIPIKKIAADLKTDTAKATKWLKAIYEQIFELNFDKPELFQKNGVKVCMYMRYFDSSCTFYTSLPVLPREFETVNFPFAKAKTGTERYWVKRVEHEISGDIADVTLWLDGETLNKYHEFALDKALFQGWIHFMDVYDKTSNELDDELKRLYKN